MNYDWFDGFTRALGASTTRRQTLRLLAGGAAGGVSAWLGGEALAPSPALADSHCQPVQADGTCPPDTQKSPKPGNTPTSNGCGPEGGSIKIPQGYGRADYTGACNNHDVCYEDCGTSKQTCDDVFLDEMLESCAESYSGALWTLHRVGCYERAYVYYKAVSWGGDDAWSAAQQKACECCSEPAKVYCACNDTCYDDVNVCLNECEVTLGCFSGICGPALPGQCDAG